jgi:hypothetical protein
MMIVAAVLLALLGALGSAPAGAADSCGKDCRDFHQACLKAHSKEACKTDYEICMKACRKKQ